MQLCLYTKPFEMSWLIKILIIITLYTKNTQKYNIINTGTEKIKMMTIGSYNKYYYIACALFILLFQIYIVHQEDLYSLPPPSLSPSKKTEIRESSLPRYNYDSSQ